MVCQKGKIKNQKTPFFDTPLFFKAYVPSTVKRKRIRDASIYTSKKISLKLLFLSDIFLFVCSA